MNEPLRSAASLYREAFGTEPEVRSRAPGRVEVLGNHTDYNDGVVLSCAIDRDIQVAVGRADNDFELVSTHYPDTVTISTVAPNQGPSWTNYPIGVCAVLRERGIDCPPFRIAVHGTIPLGAGLSSSAALEVSTAIALRALYGFEMPDEDIARVSQKAENTFAGAQCGLLDQFSSLFGKQDQLLFIDFRSFEHRTVALPRLDLSLVLTISGVTHSLADCAYNDRREECTAAARHFADKDPSVSALRDIDMTRLDSAAGALGDIVYRRARHIVGENERVLSGIRLLESGDLRGFGALLFQSHASSRDNFENSCPELDALVDLASKQDGVYGARLTGGGFGGATLALVDTQALDAYQQAIAANYRTPSGDAPEIYTARIADGAEVI